MQDVTNFISNHPILVFIALGLLVLLMIVETLRNRLNKVSIDLVQAIQKINRDNAVVIDVRSSDQFRNGHILDAVSIPANEIMESKKLEKYKKRPLLLVCQIEQNSRKIAANLINQGYNAYSLLGGMKAWTQADMPIVKE